MGHVTGAMLRLHPFLYLVLLVGVLLVANLVVYLRKDVALAGPHKPNRNAGDLKVVSVRLLETSEDSILARVQFPNRTASLLHGTATHILDGSSDSVKKYVERKARLAIVVVYAPEKKNKGSPSLLDFSVILSNVEALLGTMDAAEEQDTAVVVHVADSNRVGRAEVVRVADGLAERFKSEVDEGLLQVIAAPDNIYPSSTGASASSRLALDAAFALAYSQGISAFLLLLDGGRAMAFENSVVSRCLNLADGVSDREWSSVAVAAADLHLGRLLRGESVPKLVAFMLTSYATRSADELMHYFGVVRGGEADAAFSLVKHQPLIKSALGA